MCQRTTAEYEEELCPTKEEKERQHEKHQVVLHRTDIHQLIGHQEECLPHLQGDSFTLEYPQPSHFKGNKEDPQPSYFKEEEGGECPVGQEEADVSKFPLTVVSVKTEEHEDKPPESSQLHHSPMFHAIVCWVGGNMAIDRSRPNKATKRANSTVGRPPTPGQCPLCMDERGYVQGDRGVRYLLIQPRHCEACPSRLSVPAPQSCLFIRISSSLSKQTLVWQRPSSWSPWPKRSKEADPEVHKKASQKSPKSHPLSHSPKGSPTKRHKNPHENKKETSRTQKDDTRAQSSCHQQPK
ncbi:uncharacterized protein LOC133547384 isoform X2 [Nerophis ophidion]|uniref:uncharacterized protein LOC133547384 isoform X2 n=1 Tax=Nerophis ophidion TaxID=159077 RepID=UPI002ADFE165|nr:uncharacterized protein LOC133547384 isoform X2 [Nerophis ophidion]